MIRKKVSHKLTEFDYPLPKKYISQYPSSVRDQAKLMVLHKETGEIEHKKILDIANYLRKNDLIIFNNTKELIHGEVHSDLSKGIGSIEVWIQLFSGRESSG